MKIDISVAADNDRAYRPLTLEDFGGQPAISEQLGLFIQAARNRSETLEHVLLYGPPGLGKTTLANIIANEMQGAFSTTSGPLIQKPIDLVPILVGLEPGSILFIDEIHRMTIQAEEILYSAMEDGFIDIMLDEEAGKRSVRIQLEPFTLVGATTRSGSLSAPLRDRFGMTFRLAFYSTEDIAKVVSRASRKMSLTLSHLAEVAIAQRSRGTPRIALKLLRRVRDILQARHVDESQYDKEVTKALDFLGVNESGLNHQDMMYLKSLTDSFSGGPVGLSTLASALSEDAGTLEDVIEPYLIQEGFIQRSSRGRIALDRAFNLSA